MSDDPTRFTIDPNCLIGLDEREADAKAIRALSAAHEKGEAHLAVMGLSVPGGQTPEPPAFESLQHFSAWLAALGLGRAGVLRSMAYFDLALPDWNVFPTEEMEDIEREIHSILYPSIHYAWSDYRKANQVAEATPSRESPWRRAKCDVQAMLTHIEYQRDVFVTSSDIFHRDIKKRQLITLGAYNIEYPADAVGMI